MTARDPQNKGWAEDKGRFGFKMMEKMGWKEGAGLGSDGQGIKTFVRVQKKEDKEGIGAKRRMDQEWQENTRNLNALYAALAPATKMAPGVELPAKTEFVDGQSKHVQSSRTLVTRIIRSKVTDVGKKSAEDLACIFGKRTDHTAAKEGESDLEDDKHEDDTGVTTVKSGMSSYDYFKQMTATTTGFQRAKHSDKWDDKSSGSDDDDQQPSMFSARPNLSEWGVPSSSMSLPPVSVEPEERKRKRDTESEDATAADQSVPASDDGDDKDLKKAERKRIKAERKEKKEKKKAKKEKEKEEKKSSKKEKKEKKEKKSKRKSSESD